MAVLALAATAAADGFTITRKAKVGDIQKLTMKADADINGAAAQVNATWTEKITDVQPDGTYTVQHNQVELKVNALGNETDVPPGDPLVTIFKATGEVSKIVGDANVASPGAYRMANLEVLFDPGKPINVGDAWSHAFPADTALGTVAAKGDYKLLGEEKIGNYNTLKIQFSVKELAPAPAKPATGGAAGAAIQTDAAGSEGTLWIDKTDGSLVKAQMKWINAPVPPSPVPINATLTIDRA